MNFSLFWILSLQILFVRTAVARGVRVTSRSGELSQVKLHYVFQQVLHLLFVLKLLLVDNSLAF
jgi:hypothetical protein